jgi:hypothetical protein
MDNERMQPYEVAVHGSSSGISLIPSSLVDNSGLYRPSKELEKQVEDMWNRRSPRTVGSTSEAMAVEILDRAQVTVDDATFLLTCQKLRSIAEVAAIWKPRTGIYCDDLIAVAEATHQRLLFLTEVKGTILQQGLSRSSEAKMFYQPARTYDAIRRGMSPGGHSFRIQGVFTTVILHYQRRVVLNVLNEAAALGFFPDGWLSEGRW